MAKIKKKEEERKQHREEMAKKYPMQNPRTTVTAVLTKKDDRSQIQKIGPAKPENGGKTDSFVYRGRSNSTTWENYPQRVNRYEPKQQTWQSGAAQNAQTKAFEDREFHNKAATGWQRFQIDESNKNLLRADSTFQRWKEQFGEPEFDDDFYKPAKNWQARDNNTFGFFYSQNKEDAYRYAGILNKAYKQLDEAIAQQRAGGLEAKRAEAGLETANTAADWLKGLGLGEKLKTSWEQHGEAQKNYGEAMRQQSDNTANAWNWLWEQHKTNTSTLANAQAQQAQAQTKGVREAANSEIAQRVMNHFTESMRRQSSNMETVAEQWKDNAYLAGKYSGVTGSDQTGASIHGFRDDTSWMKPTTEWNSQELEDYRILMGEDPELAKEYAAGVNDRYNKIAHDAEVQGIADSTSQNGATAWISARAANAVSGLDAYNEALERAAIGRNNVSRNASLTEIKDTIDDTNEANITEKYGEFGGDAYRLGTELTDALIQKKALSQKNGNSKEFDISDAYGVFEAAYRGYKNAQESGEGVGHQILGAGMYGMAEVVGTAASFGTGNVLDRHTSKIPETGKAIIKEISGNVTKNTIKAGSDEWFWQRQLQIDSLKKYYMETEKMDEKRAKHKAIKHLLMREVGDIAANVIIRD